MTHRRVLTTVRSHSPITLAAFGDLLATERIAGILTACAAITQLQRKLSLVFTSQLLVVPATANAAGWPPRSSMPTSIRRRWC